MAHSLYGQGAAELGIHLKSEVDFLHFQLVSYWAFQFERRNVRYMYRLEVTPDMTRSVLPARSLATGSAAFQGLDGLCQYQQLSAYMAVR